MRHHKVGYLVEKAYLASRDEFAKWIWNNHVQIVAEKTDNLGKQFAANEDLAVAGAWLHDFGDAFVDRFADDHEEASRTEAIKILKEAGYSDKEIGEILDVIIAPHSCRDGNLPKTLEGKVLATADALAHLTTDFYLQFAWLHIPENKAYEEFVEWVKEKIKRDYETKIFFDEIREEVKERYECLRTVFGTAATTTKPRK